MVRNLAIAAVAALFVSPAAAADLNVYGSEPVYKPSYVPEITPVVAHLEVGLGFLSSDRQDGGVFNGAGRLNLPTGGGWNVLVDIGSIAFFDDGYSYATVSPVGHLWYSSGQHAYGVFVGAGFGGEPTILAGLEGLYYIGHSALGGQVAFHASDDNDYVTWKLWYDHYIHANLKASAQVDFLHADGADGWRLSGTLERRHDNRPYSGFVNLNYIDTDYDGSAFAALVGMRLFADAPGSTLYDHDMYTPFTYEGLGAFGGLD